MARIRKVIKTGNSLCLTLPSGLIKDFNVKDGDIATYKINRSKTSITYIFTGHPRQLSLMAKSKKN